MYRRRAFTLIEFLVVVAIIAILIAVLLPVLSRVRGRARQVTCAGQLRQIGVAFQAYLPGNKDRYPFASLMPSVGPAPLDTSEPVAIADVLKAPVSGHKAVFRCPDDVPGATRRPSPNTGKIYFQTERSSYAYNILLAGRTAAELAQMPGRTAFSDGNHTVIFGAPRHVMSDYANFHAPPGQRGSRRYLYVDGHVSDFE